MGYILGGVVGVVWVYSKMMESSSKKFGVAEFPFQTKGCTKSSQFSIEMVSAICGVINIFISRGVQFIFWFSMRVCII